MIDYWQHRQQPSVHEGSFVRGPAAVNIAWDLGSSINRADDGYVWVNKPASCTLERKMMKNNEENNDKDEKK